MARFVETRNQIVLDLIRHYSDLQVFTGNKGGLNAAKTSDAATAFGRRSTFYTPLHAILSKAPGHVLLNPEYIVFYEPFTRQHEPTNTARYGISQALTLMDEFALQ